MGFPSMLQRAKSSASLGQMAPAKPLLSTWSWESFAGQRCSKIQQRDITRLPMHRRARLGLGYLTQEPSIFRKLTVEQNILAILETCKLRRQERAIRLKYLLDELDLTGLAGNTAYTLSGGEKRASRDYTSAGYQSKVALAG